MAITTDMEVCICAAVKSTTGKIYRGHRHNHAILACVHHGEEVGKGKDAQGFMTTENRYVTREEGYRLQIAAGIESANPDGYLPGQLFSEDLY